MSDDLSSRRSRMTGTRLRMFHLSLELVDAAIKVCKWNGFIDDLDRDLDKVARVIRCAKCIYARMLKNASLCSLTFEDINKLEAKSVQLEAAIAELENRLRTDGVSPASNSQKKLTDASAPPIAAPIS